MWFKGNNFVAVTWKESTIIWDGVVHRHLAGQWQKMQTTGEAPARTRRPDLSMDYFNKNLAYNDLSKHITAEVIEDKMYLLQLAYKSPILMVIYRLDLIEWRWDKIAPGGGNPSRIANGVISSWPYKEKVFLLVGRKDRDESGLVNHDEAMSDFVLSSTNKLICYNTTTNNWEYPEVRGDIPGRKEMPKAVASGNTVFLFCSAAGDLHMLDMESMALSLVHGPYKPGMLFRAVIF